ncbi:hypothetical protein D1007_13325 [Hordeum vulgare]|nr:hypothetical protein D1007_13325 [Hordeum vulgare]
MLLRFCEVCGRVKTVRNDPYRFVTTTETAARGQRRLDKELIKIGEEELLNDCSANAVRMSSTLAAVVLRSAHRETEWLLHERQAAAGQGCRGPLTPFRHWRDDYDDDDIEVDGSAARRAATRMS